MNTIVSETSLLQWRHLLVRFSVWFGAAWSSLWINFSVLCPESHWLSSQTSIRVYSTPLCSGILVLLQSSELWRPRGYVRVPPVCAKDGFSAVFGLGHAYVIETVLTYCTLLGRMLQAGTIWWSAGWTKNFVWKRYVNIVGHWESFLFLILASPKWSFFRHRIDNWRCVFHGLGISRWEVSG